MLSKNKNSPFSVFLNKNQRQKITRNGFLTGRFFVFQINF
ncbi:MAG: hypothetical protein UV02_C0012G0010 [Candidatus Kuenenbacteria bacterium GW2011_GWA2_42_15]|uniref:Uncharacterized protein n=1 Tax=Candidatus Kuenenbacteria bacterium GW2011_GWA2_42_15 TaxID=1618677 RepID=A0A0G0Z141_9BACT|nr:MAG: hypothetical protein UV02_C0012G0010 [Candidatus Kuenenbacteria bacterium GW2011_GWA2_42_15]